MALAKMFAEGTSALCFLKEGMPSGAVLFTLRLLTVLLGGMKIGGEDAADVTADSCRTWCGLGGEPGKIPGCEMQTSGDPWSARCDCGSGATPLLPN